MKGTMSKTKPREIEAPAGAEALMQEYALAEAQLQQAKDAMKPLRERLLAMFPAEIGAWEIKAGKWVLEVSIPERVKWDADELTAYFGTPLPPYVKRTLAITETDFGRLSSEERQALHGARDVVLGTPKIDLSVAK